jgi:intraflagellar transport protein 122
MCYNCSIYSTHLNGNRCANCQQEYIFSFVSFEILPLAEFRPEMDITDQEAERLLMVPPKENYGSSIDPFTDIMVNEVSVI